MQTLIKKIVPKAGKGSPLGTAVHIGAGHGSCLEALKAAGAARIILVEPDAELMPLLQSHQDGARVRVIGAAIAGQSGSATLNCFNLSALSSLRLPSAAMDALFPGLRLIGRQEVRVLGLAELVQSLELAPGEDNLLILEAPGVEAELLQALSEPATDGRLLAGNFRHLLLQAGRDALFQAGAPLDVLLSRLEQVGYRVVARTEDDLDMPHVLLRLEAELPLKQMNAVSDAPVEDKTPMAGERKRAGEPEERPAAASAKRGEPAAEKDAKAVLDLTARLHRQLETTAILQRRVTEVTEELKRERALRQKLETEFARIEGQMDLMRDYLALRAPKNT